MDSAYEHANWLSYVGRFDEALAALDALQQRDPFIPTWVTETRGQSLYYLGRFEEAIAAFRAVGPQQLAAGFYRRQLCQHGKDG